MSSRRTAALGRRRSSPQDPDTSALPGCRSRASGAGENPRRRRARVTRRAGTLATAASLPGGSFRGEAPAEAGAPRGREAARGIVGGSPKMAAPSSGVRRAPPASARPRPGSLGPCAAGRAARGPPLLPSRPGPGRPRRACGTRAGEGRAEPRRMGRGCSRAPQPGIGPQSCPV